MNDLDRVIIVDSLHSPHSLDWGVRAIGAEEIWKHTKGQGVKIATIDTGIDTDHPDLTYKMGINMFEKSTNVEDERGHGTHVAGLIIGKHTGVAPEAELYIAKVLNEDGLGSMASVMDGITFAINCEVDVLCISLGMVNDIPMILKERIIQAYNKGITIVSATGNAGLDTSYYPAKMDEVIGVGGLDIDLQPASFSNYGEGTDIFAPAVDVLSTHLNGKYARMNGTSMAAPIVAGAISLLIAYYRMQDINLTPHDIKRILSLCEEYNKESKGKVLDLRKIISKT